MAFLNGCTIHLKSEPFTNAFCAPQQVTQLQNVARLSALRYSKGYSEKGKVARYKI
jgi:hypothetical protein